MLDNNILGQMVTAQQGNEVISYNTVINECTNKTVKDYILFPIACQR